MSPRFESTKHDGIFRHVKSGSFWIRDTVHGPDLKGQWVERSLRTKAITVARERAEAIRQKIVRDEKPVAERHTFSQAFDLVLGMLDGPDKDPDTLAQAEAIIDGHLRPWFEKHCPFLEGRTARYKEGFTKQFEEVWADYKREGSGRKLPAYLDVREGDPAPVALRKQQRADLWRAKPENQKPRKLAHDQRFLIMALGRAERREWLRKRFGRKDFALDQVTDPIGKHIEDEEIRKIVAAAKPHEKLYLQILMAVTMGMRIAEILHLHKDEIDLENREIDLDPHRVKTRKRREEPVPISDDVYPLLKRRYELMVENDGEFIFPAHFKNVEGSPIDWHKPQDDNRYFWDQVREQTGVELRFHDLKHTIVTNMIDAGIPETAIRKMVGTSEETLRRVYAHLRRKTREKFRSMFKGRFT